MPPSSPTIGLLAIMDCPVFKLSKLADPLILVILLEDILDICRHLDIPVFDNLFQPSVCLLCEEAMDSLGDRGNICKNGFGIHNTVQKYFAR